jgi:hypothetical protein
MISQAETTHFELKTELEKKKFADLKTTGALIERQDYLKFKRSQLLNDIQIKQIEN